jgi:hypothetical protein
MIVKVGFLLISSAIIGTSMYMAINNLSNWGWILFVGLLILGSTPHER